MFRRDCFLQNATALTASTLDPTRKGLHLPRKYPAHFPTIGSFRKRVASSLYFPRKNFHLRATVPDNFCNRGNLFCLKATRPRASRKGSTNHHLVHLVASHVVRRAIAIETKTDAVTTLSALPKQVVPNQIPPAIISQGTSTISKAGLHNTDRMIPANSIFIVIAATAPNQGLYRRLAIETKPRISRELIERDLKP